MVQIYSSFHEAKRMGMTKLIKMKFKLSDLKYEDKTVKVWPAKGDKFK